MDTPQKMDRSDIRLAVKLLRKAESTDSDPESFALALRSYSLLAGAINGFEERSDGARRRERRLLQDRRAPARTLSENDRRDPGPGNDESQPNAARRPAVRPSSSGAATNEKRRGSGAGRPGAPAGTRMPDGRAAARASEVYGQFADADAARSATELWL
jgi:hypothetical protein